MDEKYEYCTISATPGQMQAAAEALSKLGHEGFRVISTVTKGGYIIWTLERRVRTQF